MGALRCLGLGLLVSLSLLLSGTPGRTDADFDLNAQGMSLQDMFGRTMVAVTRDGSSVFSVYLDRDGTARFHNSNGKRTTGKWKRIDRVILCFTGLNADKPLEEVCKRAPENGRGLDWMTVDLHRKDGKITWSAAKKDEHRGSSQMVYSFAGRVEVDQNSYVADVTKWPGHLIVGRTMKDREAWFAHLALDGRVDFVFASGKRLKGTFALSPGQVCLTFPGNPDADGCRKPTIKGGKVMWANAKDGSAVSEIVFMKKTEIEGPREVLALAEKGVTFFSIAPDRRTAVVQNRDAGEATLYDLATGKALGKIKVGTYRDAEFSADGRKLALVQTNGVEIFDTRDGKFLGGIDAASGGTNMQEAVFLSPHEILVGDAAGNLRVFSLGFGALMQSARIGDAGIADLRVNARGQVGVVDQSGRIAVLGADLKPIKGLSAQSSGTFYGTGMTDDGASFLAAGQSNDVYLLDTTGKGIPVRSYPMPGARVASIEPAPDNRRAVVAMEGKVAILALPDLTVNETWDMGDAKINRAAYLADGRTLVVATSDGRLGLWAGDTARAQAWKARPAVAPLPDLTSLGVRLNGQRLSAAKAEELYVAGKCDDYKRQRFNLRLADRKDDCEQAATQRKLSGELDTALAKLDCARARDLTLKMGVSMMRVSACEKKVQAINHQKAFDAALAAGDCVSVRSLEVAVKKPGTSADCELDRALASGKPRAMYLAAVQLDTAGDRARARQLYTAIMQRFPDDDLAIDAANRLTALADLQTMEERAADQAATQAAALKAAEDRARAAEAAAKAAATQAEQERLAREAEARAAEQARAQAAAAQAEAQRAAQAAAAAAQPQRNTACDHVTPGQRFEVKDGGFLGMDAYFDVIGISREGGIVTARLLGTDIQRQFSCYDVR